jgi:hypothetical protein
VLNVNAGRNETVLYLPGDMGDLTSSGIVPVVTGAVGEAAADVAVPAGGLLVAALPELPPLHPATLHPVSTHAALTVAIVHRFIGPLLGVGVCLMHRPGEAGRLLGITLSRAMVES